MLRNQGIALIYERALEETIPRVPRKYFKNPIPQTSPMEKELRKELIIKEVEHEIKRLRMTASLKSDFVKRIDEEVSSHFMKNFNSTEAQAQIAKWRETTQKEENVSKNIWEERSKFFESDKHLLSIDSRSKRPNDNYRNGFMSYADVTRYPAPRQNFRRYDNYPSRRNFNDTRRNNRDFRGGNNRNFTNNLRIYNRNDRRDAGPQMPQLMFRNNFPRRMNNRNNIDYQENDEDEFNESNNDSFLD